jgi:diaminopimelate epimerase
MKPNIFRKFCGAGNDFILFDLNDNPEFNISSDIILNICDRRFGIGADGVLLIGDEPGYDFKMTYYNSDGSLGSLCGNGARCAIKYADLSGRLDKGRTKFICNNEVFAGQIENDTVIFFLNEPKNLSLNLNIELYGSLTKVHFLNTGSPHVVVDVNELSKSVGNKISFTDINDLDVYSLGREIRYHSEFMPEGTNVNFIQLSGEDIKIRTFERGVEDETLACGTGSVASALISNLVYGLPSPVSLLTRGGDKLKVGFRNAENSFEEIFLSGPAVEIFKGEIFL